MQFTIFGVKRDPPIPGMSGKKVDPSFVKSSYLWVCLIFLLGLIAGKLLQGSGRRASTAQSAVRVGGVEIRGQIESDFSYPGKPLRLWILLDNQGPGEIQDLRILDFQMPGFTQNGSCWVANAPACRVGLAKGNHVGLPSTLSAGESTGVWGDVILTADSGAYLLSTEVGWSLNKSATTHVLAIGPIQAASRWRELVSSSAEAALSVTKDLALPIVLVILGLLFQRQQARRAEDQKEEEEKEARVLRTWTLMLPKSHENAEKYYLPLLSHTSRFQDMIRNVAMSEEDKQQAFYNCASVLRGMRHLREEIGGFYFKNRLGEALAAQAWKRFLLLSEKKLGKERVAEVRDVIGPADSYSVFMARFRGPHADLFEDLYTEFKRWLAEEGPEGLRKNMCLIRLFEVVLDHEANRPYEYWYRELEKAPEDWGDIVRELDECGGLEFLRETFKTYVQQIQQQST